jgi:hypothetical protein
MSVLGDIIAGVLEAGLEALAYGAFDRRRASPPLPSEPTALEFMGMAFGVIVVFLGLAGLGIFLHQWTSERLVLREAPAQAVIVSIEKKQSDGRAFADVRLDYQRQTPTGPVACRRAQARIWRGSRDLELGKMVEVYSQPGSCTQPFYAPDIGNPRKTLLASLLAFPIGIAMLCSGYSSWRRRQRQLAVLKSAGKPTAAIP